jgi:hypothetical protein
MDKIKMNTHLYLLLNLLNKKGFEDMSDEEKEDY